MINEPKIIMCDEPTSNLDSKNSQIVFDILKQLAHQNHHIIISITHDSNFARNSDITIEMADGRIIN